MKKYKLIKEYPGSPEIGRTVTPKSSSDNFCYWEGSWFDPEKHPEFWEEIKEPLFITADGISVFENDSVFQIDFKGGSPDHIFEYKAWKSYFGNNGVPFFPNRLYKSRERAEEFITLNKKQYSKLDLIDLLDFKHWQHPIYTDEEVVNNFIKQREKDAKTV